MNERRARIRSPNQLAPGTEVQGYRIVRKLAVGGTAWVFEGQHIESNRRVAIKVLSDQYRGDSCLVRRFANEARAVMTLDSPHIITIESVGTLSAGLPFIVMEYLDGLDLYHLLEQYGWRMPVDVALSIVDQVAQALELAHAHGIIHRDIKPENIFVLATSDGLLAKVLDFGLSRVPRAGENSSLTRTGTTVGTPHYMALEQLRGDRTIDGRADVYSLGVLTYELLSGHCPFEGPDLHEIMQRAAREQAPSLHDYRPDLPEGLVQAIAHAMTRDRNKRCPSARAFREAIRPFWNNESTQPESSPTRGSSVVVQPERNDSEAPVPTASTTSHAPSTTVSPPKASPPPTPHPRSTQRPAPRHNPLATIAAVVFAALMLSLGLTCFVVDTYQQTQGTAKASLPSAP
ncbi:MAG TPA: serine/threonine-protein kinase [Polyangiaceae bacterium]|nr:MAG: Serine/threonine-protein kinase StkP [Deltaproteobacteria bacterium ADurb.Bin207]HNS96305.1 serine/threonine-protein kinase [Polyangiaceae bacterium]HNZ22037.1 serine/threonine-protein kinase [Polyangiaceae bacterium]HOD22207.1 serine/threonine-protein kinase [Polyangiaceae bacterium]HOE47345.1 serine/threonine-protein kinase [Polyangiaceae bacterium]